MAKDKDSIWNVISPFAGTVAGYISIILNRSKSKLKMAIFFRKINKSAWYLSNFPHAAKGGPCYLPLTAKKSEIHLQRSLNANKLKI
jgi:hypothetical protein